MSISIIYKKKKCMMIADEVSYSLATKKYNLNQIYFHPKLILKK